MSDYLIDLQTAIEAMSRISDSICEAEAVDALCELPTVNAVPVKRGKWIWNDKCKRVCSVCENPVAFMLSKDGWHEGRYCPNCGARMRAD